MQNDLKEIQRKKRRLLAKRRAALAMDHPMDETTTSEIERRTAKTVDKAKRRSAAKDEFRRM